MPQNGLIADNYRVMDDNRHMHFPSKGTRGGQAIQTFQAQKHPIPSNSI